MMNRGTIEGWKQVLTEGMERSENGFSENGYVFLVPYDRQKSFYKKCSVIFRDGKALLKSYNTIVAEYSDKDGFKRLWDSYSVTTMRHINAFRVYCGLETISKKEWCAL